MLFPIDAAGCVLAFACFPLGWVPRWAAALNGAVCSLLAEVAGRDEASWRSA